MRYHDESQLRGFRHRRRHFGPTGPPHGRGRGGRARRGDVRAALLVLLAEEPRNGYGLMQEIETRSDGAWRPSPGSVYPTLSQLEDEGLVTTVQEGGRKTFTITPDGEKVVAERADAPAPWDEVKGDVSSEAHELGHLIRQVAIASAQVLKHGSKSQIEAARDLMSDTRKKLYGILAED